MSSLAFPIHDPNNIEIKFLWQILPLLKANFDRAFVTVTWKTMEQNKEVLPMLQKDDFFVINTNNETSLIGDDFVECFKNVIKNSSLNEVIHLCCLDRLAFGLLNYQEQMLSDLKQIETEKCPTVFERSEEAWSTHPINYRAAEAMVTEAGKILFGQSLDFGWCHLTLTTEQLSRALPSLTAHDLVVFAQLIMAVKENLLTKKVDWLAWEDPFIFGKEAEGYKKEREAGTEEVEKRMSYVLPDIKYLFECYRKQLGK